MATAEYYQWVSRGKPYALTKPARDIQRNVRRYGITVYDYPNDAHLKAAKPEDHTPFSYTKWPNANHNVDGVGRALDIMPRGDSYVARKENADIARQIIRDKDAKVPGTEGIKYLNWTDENGVCRQENWKSGKRITVSSSDKGHIHISFRNDTDNSSAEGYDPVARMHGQTPANAQEEDMPFVAKDGKTGKYYVCDMIVSRPVPDEAITDVLYLAKQLNYGHGTEGVEWTDGGWVRLGWSEAVFGTLQGRLVGIDSSPTPIDVGTVKAGTLAALKDPEGQAALHDAAFEAAQDAEKQ